MSNTEMKENGKYFTPPSLAKFLVNLSINEPDLTILDPAYGNGALLLAAHERLKYLGSINPAKNLFGIDIFPLCKKFQKQSFQGILDEKNLSERDFFSYSPRSKQKFSLILMNPPFIRHHKINSEQYLKIDSAMRDKLRISKYSDMWAYFILHSLKFIRKNGSIAAILPWSFIQAIYAKPIQNILKENFESIEIIVLGQHFFDQAQERILILYGKNFGIPSEHFSIGYSHEIPKNSNFLLEIDGNDTLRSPWNLLFLNQYKNALKKIKRKIPISEFGDFADIKIGTVTGANSFFILDADTIKENQIQKSILEPIITNSKELRKLSINSIENWKKYLLMIPEQMEIDKSLLNYIQMGENIELDKRYHTGKRKHWYCIPEQKNAEAFLPYMSKEIPFLTFNPSKVLSTNSVHQVFFKDSIDENTKKWIQFSMFSSLSQLSIELSAKTYGGGILKIEPSSAKKILVYSGSEQKFPMKYEKEINKLLEKNKRDRIIDFVDNWFIQTFDIPDKTYDEIKKSYREVRTMRQN